MELVIVPLADYKRLVLGKPIVVNHIQQNKDVRPGDLVEVHPEPMAQRGNGQIGIVKGIRNIDSIPDAPPVSALEIAKASARDLMGS